MTPSVVMRPTLPPLYSVNQSAPSGPVVIPVGALVAVGIGNSMKVCAAAPAAQPNARATQSSQMYRIDAAMADISKLRNQRTFSERHAAPADSIMTMGVPPANAPRRA